MIETNLNFQKKDPKKLVCPFVIALFRFGRNLIKFGFLIFQFWTIGNFTPGRSEAEKLTGSGKKIIRLSREERFLEPKLKKRYLCYSRYYIISLLKHT